MKLYWPLFRWIVLILWFLLMKFVIELSTGLSVTWTFILIITYQKIIAKIKGYDAMPSMDAATLLSSAKCHVNFINVVHYDSYVTEDVIRFNLGKLMKFMPKFTQHIVEYGGEYYYKYLDEDPSKA